ncbi:uncharacterized protein LOC124929011 [Impatiens glandulifera]|uniref:uncharacterized protein LOC124929011 n=1 Tax=Impatiens glandulifera TaxID=253017 RepID=UPI001FB11071|nr:uncharacterized protein LOC124929011 [Impatiens glandulifera]
MKTIDLANIWRRSFFCFLILNINFTNAYKEGYRFGPRNHHPVTYSYDRIDEVNKVCGTVISSASELKPDDTGLYSIKEELSFTNGDWRQGGNDKASLMPFDDRDAPNGSVMARESPLNLISFRLMDVDRAHRSKKSFLVSGSLLIGFTRQGLLNGRRRYEENPYFNIWPGHSELLVSFQGVYTENGGERVLCLLGNAMLPAREPQSPDPWEWDKVSGYTNQPPLLQDDQILLVLHFPMTLTLTNREIHGKMTSLNPKSSQKYFDDVYISSWMGASADYEFGSEELVSRACDPYPYPDSSTSDHVNVYKGRDLCSFLTSSSHEEFLSISPNWGCSGTDEFCSKLGPFSSDYGIKKTDGGFKDVKLVLQDVRCKQEDSIERISAVFRAVPPFENQYYAGERTGLNNMTLLLEGKWKASSGQLCMIGCHGNGGCDSRVILYIPLVFSIQQRSIIKGTISSIVDKNRNENSSFYPLSFEKLVRPAELWDKYTSAHPYYRYSKIDQAIAIMEKKEPFSVGDIIKKSLLNFPKLEDTEAFEISLSYLSEDLTLQTSAVHDPLKTRIQLEIISIGKLFGRFWPSNDTITEETPYRVEKEYTENQLLLNISAQLTLSGDSNSNTNFSSVFLEGLYDQRVGKMYLIGCRDVRASWTILSESNDLEFGLDCLVEVVVSYPSTSNQWLSPTATLSISSRRNEDDPLYFKPVNLQTFPIMYRKQREDIISRTVLEGIFRMVTLSVAIGFIVSQLFYVRDNVDFVPYISLTMIGVQLIGYSLSLVTGAEAIFKRMKSETYESSSNLICYAVKLLVLVAFLLTLRLLQKVWKSRIKLLSRAPQEPHRVPSEKRVVVVTLITHLIMYFVILAKTSQKKVKSNTIDSFGNQQTVKEWEFELEEYIGLIQDWFLLPQIIGNLVWQIDCRPLRKLYFIGITVVRILPHVYDYVRPPTVNPYFSEEYEFVNPRLDFYTRFSDAAIPVTAILLAVIVFIQQRWNYEEISKRLVIGRFKLLPVGSRVYERLPSKTSFETELASSGGDHAKEKDEHEESDSD